MLPLKVDQRCLENEMAVTCKENGVFFNRWKMVRNSQDQETAGAAFCVKLSAERGETKDRTLERAGQLQFNSYIEPRVSKTAVLMKGTLA